MTDLIKPHEPWLNKQRMNLADVVLIYKFMGHDIMLSELIPLTTLSQSTHPCRGYIDNFNGLSNSVVVLIHPPCRVRLPNHSPIPWKLEVSIHVPTQGATVQAPQLLPDVLRWIEIPNDYYHLFWFSFCKNNKYFPNPNNKNKLQALQIKVFSWVISLC
jgi:hypothetical protein